MVVKTVDVEFRLFFPPQKKQKKHGEFRGLSRYSVYRSYPGRPGTGRDLYLRIGKNPQRWTQDCSVRDA